MTVFSQSPLLLQQLPRLLHPNPERLRQEGLGMATSGGLAVQISHRPLYRILSGLPLGLPPCMATLETN